MKPDSITGKILEASLPMNTSHDALRGHLRGALMKAHGVTSPWESNGPFVMDTFPNHVVYSHQNQLYQRKYTSTPGGAGSDPTITLGEPKKTHAAYMNSSEAASESVMITVPDGLNRVQESGDSVMCFTTEQFAAVKEAKGSTNVPIKIIAPGWGSSAYYSKEVLQRDGPKVFKAGTHMYWNHATETESIERPEGDLNDLAAVLMKDAQWNDNGIKGPGLYSEAKVFSDYSSQVSEKGPHIGVSINAGIKCHEGEAEGRSGKIADQFVVAYSTDFVTKAGAGGAPIVPAKESERRSPVKENKEMTEQEIKALNDRLTALEGSSKTLEAENTKLKTENAALIQGQNVVLAVATVGSVLKEAEIPFNQKVLERACVNPVLKEGKLDQDWVKSIVSDFSDGVSGRVTGMGQGREAEVQTDEKVAKAMESAMKRMGVPEAGLAIATKGR